MKFLEEIAAEILKNENLHLENLTVVFPNRRAGLFFQKYLAAGISQPVWSPQIMSISDFIKSLTRWTVPDRLTLVYLLYRIFSKMAGASETFDKFYFWGETLLRDFDEIDKFLVNPEPLFSNLADLKDLEQTTAYLNEHQKRLISRFWNTFEENRSGQQKNFLSIWKILYRVYNDFRRELADRSFAYEGMIYRHVAEEIKEGSFEDPFKTVYFAGFNALSPAEETIITWYVHNREAQIYWDADDHYLKNDDQEAGNFMRKIRAINDILAKTFKNSYGNRFRDPGNKKITLIGTPLKTGQAQVASALLEDLNNKNPEIFAEDRTALVLPDEKLLVPLLNALPKSVEKVNITMGYPLKHSLLYSFIENLVRLQVTRKKHTHVFHYQAVLSVLTHPFISGVNTAITEALVKSIKSNNKIYIPAEKLAGNHELLGRIFTAMDDVQTLIEYLLDILVKLTEINKDVLQQEFFLHFFTRINKLKDFIRDSGLSPDIQSFLKLFRQVIALDRLPFEGEPLEGLQVMGAMETRNLDFDQIIIFSVNEGVLPPSRPPASFIPYALRQAFELPVFDHQEAMYAYVFYRMIQRAQNVFLIYDTSEEQGVPGEVSRFVKQMEFELRNVLDIDHKIISPPVPAYAVRSVSVTRKESMMRELDRYTEQGGEEKWLTPSALNIFQECSLRFYYRYILGLSEEDEVQEDMDPILFGKIFHSTMELAYKQHNEDGHRWVRPENIEHLKKNIGVYIEGAFRKHFDLGSPRDKFEFSGQNIIIREIVKKMALKLLDYDLKYAPFEILGLEFDPGEKKRLKLKINRNGRTIGVKIGGIIDRVDKKGDVIRILDYKTGTDKKDFTNIRSLFHFAGEENQKSPRNKAAFQTLLYGLIFKHAFPDFSGKIEAGLLNVRDIYKKDFSYLLVEKPDKSKKYIDDVSPYLPEFEQNLRKLLEEIFSFEGAFAQTPDENKCRYCSFKDLCQRDV